MKITENKYDTIHCDNCDKDINAKFNHIYGNIFLYFSLRYQLEQLFENSDLYYN